MRRGVEGGRSLVAIVALCAFLHISILIGFPRASVAESRSSFYDLRAQSIEGPEVSLGDYRGKVVLVVNTASKCGFTAQYADLQKLYERFSDRGLAILGFPSNDFANLEPGSNAKIREFCRFEFGVTFPMFARLPVTGPDIQPVFKFLTQSSGEEFEGPVEWNFEKFLIDRKGQVRARYCSFTNPVSGTMTERIEALLAEEA